MLLNVFANNILPPLLIVAAGFVLERTMGVDPRSLTRVTVYVFMPALIIGSLIDTKVAAGEFAQIALFVILYTGSMWGMGQVVTRLLRFDRRLSNAFLLSTLFGNCGNLGLAVVLFACGPEGLERALAFFVVSSLLTHTLAAYFASRGTASIGQSIANVFKLPMIYAAALALAVRVLGLGVPAALMRTIDLPRAGAIPLMQLLLGVQLAGTSRRLNLRFVGSATAVQQIAGPLIAVALGAAMGLGGLTRSVCIVQAGMPSAVNALIYAIQFGSHPEEVGGVVFCSTLSSAVTLTVLVALLG